MSKESFIRIPLGMDCRASGQKSPTRAVVIPQDWKDVPGISFGRGEWAAKGWLKDRRDDK